MDTEDGHNADLTRREVLSTAGAAGIVAGADALVGHGHAQAGKPPHVVIVGAGLAGLCAAHELQKRRWTYTILEADKLHVGGRVRTVRFSNGTYGELGAMRIPENHKTTLRYVDEFRLPRREFVMDNPATYYHARNHRPEPRSALDKFRRLYRLEPGEMNKTPDDLWGDAVAGLLKTLSREERSDLDTSNSFTTSKITELDRLSLRRAMEMGGLSEEAIELLCVTYGVGTLQHSALTEHLREESNDVWTRPFYEIEGGTERLPDEFKKRLYSKPNMGHEVIALEQDENGATAVYRSARQRNRVTGDFLLCTIPLPVLARLETPSFSGEKRRAIRDVFYESATKVLVPTNTRVWETDDKIFGGNSFTDLMISSIFYPSDNSKKKEGSTTKEREAIDAAKSKGPGVLVASYAWGQEARRLGNMTASQREELAIKMAGKVHGSLERPGVIRRDEVRSWAWDNHPWAGGAFAFYMPGQFAALHRHVVAPEGRIYFAGEHCSRSHSWMQGALDSAEEAVNAMAARVG
jgi:monoamine oxidase